MLRKLKRSIMKARLKNAGFPRPNKNVKNKYDVYMARKRMKNGSREAV